MSLKGTSGTSLVEVMIMMVIFGMSIVGIYGLVNSGRELATLTDTRLMAINIAREGLESVATLRDTFGLKGYESGTCRAAPINPAFFSIDERVLTATDPINCPQISNTYILQNNKTLIVEGTNYDVCINESGWYSQEFSNIGSNALDICRESPTANGCITCSSTTTLCTGNITQKCRTKFKRKITFESCPNPTNLQYCVKAKSTVLWGSETADKTLELSQFLTPLD